MQPYTKCRTFSEIDGGLGVRQERGGWGAPWEVWKLVRSTQARQPPLGVRLGAVRAAH